MRRRTFLASAVSVFGVSIIGQSAAATNYYVSRNGGSDTNPGTLSRPFATINNGLKVARAGDAVIVRGGTYSELLKFPNGGSSNTNRLVLRAYAGETVTVLTPSDDPHLIRQPYVTVENIIFDGQYCNDDIIEVRTGGDWAVLRHCEVKQTQQEGIELNGVSNILIDGCIIHHCLRGTFASPSDAHGIRGDNITNVTIRGTEIYYVSGDAFQASPNRDPWDNVFIEDCHFWTGPLPAAAEGFGKGQVPGENAIDTKQRSSNPRSRIYISDCIFNGWRNGTIPNMAALNLKDWVQATVERCLFYDNNMSLRYRGGTSGAIILTTNCVTYGNSQATLRYEDKIGRNLRMYNNTFGANKSGAVFYQRAPSGDPAPDTLNGAFLGTKPAEATDNSNLSLSAADFKNPGAGDYHLVANSDAIDAGTSLTTIVPDDFDGIARPRGQRYDVGAYEFVNGG
jgi:hypothetical protein